MVVGSNLSWQGIKKNGSVHRISRPGMSMYRAVYTGWGVDTGGAKFFYLVIEIDQSETTKRHMFSMSL